MTGFRQTWSFAFLLLAFPAVSWSVTTFVVIGVLACLAYWPVKAGVFDIGWKAQQRPIVIAAHELVREYPDEPIVIRMDGPVVTLGAGLGVVSELIADSKDIYYDYFWNRDEWDRQRRTAEAPESHLTLHILQQHDDNTWPDTGEDHVLRTADVYIEQSDIRVRLVLTKNS